MPQLLCCTWPSYKKAVICTLGIDDTPIENYKLLVRSILGYNIRNISRNPLANVCRGLIVTVRCVWIWEGIH